MRAKKDILWKGIIEVVAPEMLPFLFENAASIFDLEKGFEFLDKELLELFPERAKQGGNRLVDKLIKVFTQDGVEKWILLHVEVHGGDTKNFAERMFTYFYRIYDRYKVKITAYTIFTGPKSQKTPTEFNYDFLGTGLVYRYNSLHITDFKEEQLLSMGNAFALVILAAQKALLVKVSLAELAQQRLTIAKALLGSRKYSHEKIVRIIAFLKEMVYINDSEINATFNAEIDLLTGKNNSMDILELIADERAKVVAKKVRKEVTEKVTAKVTARVTEKVTARVTEKVTAKVTEKVTFENSRIFVENLINNTEFSDEKIASLANVSVSFVQTVRAGQ